MKVKICGIKSKDVAKYAVKCGADALGFVFADSKRRVQVEKAKEIIDELPPNIWKVGVFVNEEEGTIQKTAETAGLTHIQLHGEENLKNYSNLSLPIIQSVSVHSNGDSKKIRHIDAPFILLDSPPGKYKGGNGRSFDWSKAYHLGHFKKNLILAGGLNEKNVQEAILKVKPFMVDVSTGVETNGEKDFFKIRAFINAAKKSGEEEKE